MKDFTAIAKILSSPKRVFITVHASPDADALGSALGLDLYLKKLGHNTSVVVPTAYPTFLNWMPGEDSIIVHSEETEQEVDTLIKASDLIFCLDFSGLNRIDSLGPKIADASCQKIVIDHHLNPEHVFDMGIWDVTAAATAELIYDLIHLSGHHALLDDRIGACLYAGIMTDTGNFRHSNTTSKVHRIVADLIDIGVRVHEVSANIYDTNSLARLRFLGYALNELLVLDLHARIGYFAISKADASRFQLKQGDTEGLVNYALSVNGIELAILMKESEGSTKFSFRSVGKIAVNDFAATYFNGGGHKNAAGGKLEMSLDESKKYVQSLIAKDILSTYEIN